MEKIKQVIIIRKDLKMRRGKEIAQGSHASMDFLVERLRGAASTGPSTGPSKQVSISLRDTELKWISEGMAKICLQASSETELINIHEKARTAGLEAHLIRDSGKTEFGGVPTLTALAIGPDSSESIDLITGDLTLY
jgi:PTH2 family peptidyl-tRNA hydrolase